MALTCGILQGLGASTACGDDNTSTARATDARHVRLGAGAINNAARCFQIRCRRRRGRQIRNGLCASMLRRQYTMVYGANAADCGAVGIWHHSANGNTAGCINAHAGGATVRTTATARSWAGACAKLDFIDARAFHHA